MTDHDALAALLEREVHRVLCGGTKHRFSNTGYCRQGAPGNIARGLIAAGVTLDAERARPAADTPEATVIGGRVVGPVMTAAGPNFSVEFATPEAPDAIARAAIKADRQAVREAFEQIADEEAETNVEAVESLGWLDAAFAATPWPTPTTQEVIPHG